MGLSTRNTAQKFAIRSAPLPVLFQGDSVFWACCISSAHIPYSLLVRIQKASCCVGYRNAVTGDGEGVFHKG